MEAKDFRPRVAAAGIGPNAAASGNRWKELPLEIALKIRDSLAGVLGAFARSSHAQWQTVVTPALGRAARACEAPSSHRSR